MHEASLKAIERDVFLATIRSQRLPTATDQQGFSTGCMLNGDGHCTNILPTARRPRRPDDDPSMIFSLAAMRSPRWFRDAFAYGEGSEIVTWTTVVPLFLKMKSVAP